MGLHLRFIHRVHQKYDLIFREIQLKHIKPQYQPWRLPRLPYQSVAECQGQVPTRFFCPVASEAYLSATRLNGSLCRLLLSLTVLLNNKILRSTGNNSMWAFLWCTFFVRRDCAHACLMYFVDHSCIRCCTIIVIWAKKLD